jgi:hypothetical protein
MSNRDEIGSWYLPAEVDGSQFIMPFSSEDIRSRREYSYSKKMRRDNRSKLLVALDSENANHSDIPSEKEKENYNTRSLSEGLPSKLRSLAGKIRDFAKKGLQYHTNSKTIENN